LKLKLLLILTLAFSSLIRSQSVDSPQGIPAQTDKLPTEAPVLLPESGQYNTQEQLNRKLRAAQASGNRALEAEYFNEAGDHSWYSGDYPGAARNYYAALAISESLRDQKGISTSYRNIGWIYLGQKNYKKALSYFNKSLALKQLYGTPHELISAYDDLGILHRTTGNYPLALGCFDRTIQLSEHFNDTKAMAAGKSNLASVYLKLERHDLAVIHYQRAIELQQMIGDDYNLCVSYMELGSCYILLKHAEKAIHYLKQALSLARQNNYLKIEADVLKHLGTAFALKEDYASAYNATSRYAFLSDSITDEDQNRQIHEMSSKYELHKNEASIRTLEKNQLLMNERFKHESRFRISLLSFLGILIMVAFALFRNFRQKQKANRNLQMAYVEIECRNKDMDDSIMYARQIQLARLPDRDEIHRLFPESFRLFKPKDVVSGDFYWFSELGNENIVFAAADCTGHGIPGAFMSLIGMDNLNHAVNKEKLTHPGEILECVNVNMKKALRQNTEYSNSRDGMDIALCVFNPETLELFYAGAHRPLILVRQGEFIKTNPTKNGIGGLTSDDQIFETHRLQLEKGDMLYLFSDGYVDQFGGDCDKKFMSGRFRELLLKIHTMPSIVQEAVLEQTFENWKGKCDQIDDVLVIGICI